MQRLILCLFLVISITITGRSQNCGNGVPSCTVSLTQGNGPVVYTPNGTIVFTLTSNPLYPCEVSAGDVEFNNYSGLTAITCPTSDFNCHGYAWYMEFGGSGQRWIESNQVSKYWNDGSFYEVFSSPVNVKGVVLYYDSQNNITHSAVTVPNYSPTRYRSKWGAGYLVEHAPNNVPSGYGAASRYFLRCGSCDTAPNLLAMTYNLGTVNSVNFVPAGGYNIYTNVPECQLTINQNISWSTYGGFSNWGTVGQRKLSAWFNLSSGQSVTFSISAPSNCGTSVRSPAFVAQSGYRMYSSNQVKDRLTIEFDNVDYLEILPQTIVISDEKTGLEEKVISMKELFDGKQFDNKKISIDVKKLSRGMKIVNFFYHNLNSKTVQEKLNKQEVNTEFERQSDRVILVD